MSRPKASTFFFLNNLRRTKGVASSPLIFSVFFSSRRHADRRAPGQPPDAPEALQTKTSRPPHQPHERLRSHPSVPPLRLPPAPQQQQQQPEERKTEPRHPRHLLQVAVRDAVVGVAPRHAPGSARTDPSAVRQELQRLHAEPGREVQQRQPQRVSIAVPCAPFRPLQFDFSYFSAARNGFPPPLDQRFKASFPGVLQNIPTPPAVPGKEEVAARKQPDFASLVNPFASPAMFPPLIDMSTTQALIAMVRTAKEAELQGLLKNVKRPEPSSPLDLSAAAPAAKRPRTKTPGLGALGKRAESESPRLHEDVAGWSVDDVCNFVAGIDICAEYARVSVGAGEGGIFAFRRFSRIRRALVADYWSEVDACNHNVPVTGSHSRSVTYFSPFDWDCCALRWAAICN